MGLRKKRDEDWLGLVAKLVSVVKLLSLDWKATLVFATRLHVS
jgi:hypothetical protein